MTRFVTSLAAGSLLLLAVGAASAADLGGGPRMSIKDSEPGAPYRACSGDRFAGAYLGGTIGIVNQRAKWNEISADNGLFVDFSDHPLDTERNGGAFGLTAGYNIVRCNFVMGIEGDFNFNSVSKTTNHFPTNPDAGSGYARITDGMRDFATLRGRLGFVADRTLFYATGGLAWANLNHKLEDIAHFDGGNTNPTFSGWKQGWTVGGGFETALTEMISLKGEALYMDFGKRGYSIVDSVPAPNTDVYLFQTKSSATVARLGLNFKLGGPPRSVSRCEDGGDNCCPDGRSPAKGGHCPLK